MLEKVSIESHSFSLFPFSEFPLTKYSPLVIVTYLMTMRG